MFHLKWKPRPPRCTGRVTPAKRRGFLRHRQHAGEVVADRPVQLLQELDRFEILAAAVSIRRPLAVLARVVEIEHRGDRVHAQAVDVILLDPEQRVRDQEVAHFVAAVVEDLRAPLDCARRGCGSACSYRCVPSNSARPCASLRKMRRHPVHEHADAGLVQPVDEALEIVRRAVPRGRREVAEHLVAPRAVERMLGDADQLDVRVAEVEHVRNQLIGQLIPGEERRLAMPRAAPRARMQFVDVDRRAQRIPRAALRQPLAVVPVIAADIGDDRGVVRPQLHLERVRIGLELHVAVRVDELEFVERARADVRHERLPHARVGAPLHDGLRCRPSD